MKHSIISWDCSFRNFFHLIDALLLQDYPKNDYELIYVEQRTKEYANNYNKQFGCKSLEDRYNEVKNKINIKIIYLNDPIKNPYNLGITNNAGIKIAKGEIISVMDGDQLLDENFLKILEDFHNKNPKAVVNVHRRMCEYPVGVRSFKDWTKGDINFKRCNKASVERFRKIPIYARNIGPMISARKEFRNKTGMYNEHKIRSTVLSLSGSEMNTRLEIATKFRSLNLPNTYTLHPRHPKGGGLKRKELDAQRYLKLQKKIINFYTNEKIYKQSDINKKIKKIFEKNKEFIEDMNTLGFGETEDITKYNFRKIYFKTKILQIAIGLKQLIKLGL